MSSTDPLNFGLPSPVPNWLPDETFFSLASRYHRLTGNRLASTTCTALFGHPRQGSQHDFPNRIAEFCGGTNNTLGDEREIALTRTLLPFYLPMRTPTEAIQAIAAMTGTQSGNLKFRLGILTSRFRANHPLKACACCMAEDIARHGVAYWHLGHQYPGIWICTEHQVYLMQSSMKSTGVGRFLWALPQLDELSFGFALEETALEGAAHKSALLRFAYLAQGLAHLPAGEHLFARRLAMTYRVALFERGLLAKSGRLNLPQLGANFAASVLPLRSVPELSGLAASEEEAALHLGRWLRAPRGGTHPLRHLAIIYWLFPNWDVFMLQYRAAINESPFSATMHLPNAPQIDSRQAQVISLLKQGTSISQVARIVGIDVQTAMAWAAKAGLQPLRRPKVLKKAVLQALIEVLRVGIDKADAAQQFSISVETVTRILRSEVGLQAAWHQAKAIAARERTRQAWLGAVSHSPHIGIKALRALQPSAYAWLYRNDRDWLQTQCQVLRLPPQQSTGVRVAWDLRDVSLSTAVRQVAADIAGRDRVQRIALWQIYQVLPELKAKLDVLDRLPLTRTAIKEVTRRRAVKARSGDLL